ncbi:hypothetical protein DN30_3585 [Vibrio cholerae]|nr:hypothetical protein DN30_3585 [Vibrio cholerae]
MASVGGQPSASLLQRKLYKSCHAVYRYHIVEVFTSYYQETIECDN